ncbi:MAG: hypothetical protein ACREV8_02750 [Gammaproteobacteria bacterium]
MANDGGQTLTLLSVLRTLKNGQYECRAFSCVTRLGPPDDTMPGQPAT